MINHFCYVCSQVSCFGSHFDCDIHLSGIKRNKKGKLKHQHVLLGHFAEYLIMKSDDSLSTCGTTDYFLLRVWA